MVPQVPLNSSSTRPEVGEFVGLTNRTVGSMIIRVILFYPVQFFQTIFFTEEAVVFENLEDHKSVLNCKELIGPGLTGS